MKKIIKKIKYWFWWYFQATEEEKSQRDALVFGTGFMKDGKRINPKNF